MRAMTAIMMAATALVAFAAPSAAETISRQDAAGRVRSAGYQYVSKTEAAPGLWDIWASKDGIAYEVKVSASDGHVVAAVPLEDND